MGFANSALLNEINITIFSPIEGQTYATNQLSLDTNISGSNPPFECWYFLNEDGNTLYDCVSTSFTAGEGFNNIWVVAIDSTGVSNSKQVTFNVDTTPPDTTPPSKVLGLTVNPVSTSELDLSWSANTEQDLNFYNVYRNSGVIAFTSQTTYSDSGLEAGTTYCYQVSAIDVVGNEGDLSDQVCGTTLETQPEPEPNSIHVESIVLTKKVVNKKGNVFCSVEGEVLVLDLQGNPVHKASVSASWSGASNLADSSVTRKNGIAKFSSERVKGCGSFTFTVDNIEKNGLIYDPLQNIETSETINTP